MKTRIPVILLALCVSAGALLAQSAPAADNSPAPAAAAQKAPDKAEAYYHYSIGHIYEELASMYGRVELANQAAEEYRLAIQSDPSSDFLNSTLAELYFKTGRISDAISEAEGILKRDPDNADAHRLLGRIYLRSLGDLQSGTQSSKVLQRALEEYQAIVRLEPDSVEDHLLLGRIYRMNNEIAKAENEFKTAVRLQPSSEEAVTMLAYLYNEQGNSAHAVEILNSVPDTQRSARLYSALGYTYEQQRNFKKAIEAYRQAVKEDSDNLEAMRGLGQNLLNDDQNDAALAQYKAIIKADPQDAQSYMRIAELYRRSHNYNQALDALKKAQSYAPDSLEIPFNMAVLYQTQGRYDEAVTILKDLVSKSEKPGSVYSPGERNNRAIFLERLSDLYHETGRYQLAVDTLRKMIDLGGENATRAYQEIVDTYRDGKMWTQATDAAKEGVAKLPNDRTLRMVLAVQMADTGQSEAALDSAKALLKGTPEDREVYLNLAQMTTRLKRFKEAEQYVAKAYALAAKEDDKELATFIWGTVYERQKKYDEAEKMFKKVLASDARNTQTLNYLGYMLADRGTRLHEALGYVKKAVELDPQNGAYLDSLGWTYFKLGDYDMAETTLRHASERIGSDPTLQDHLGELYAKTGRLKLAATHWERAIQEWNKSVPADVDSNDLQRVTKKLESAKTKLARQQASK